MEPVAPKIETRRMISHPPKRRVGPFSLKENGPEFVKNSGSGGEDRALSACSHIPPGGYPVSSMTISTKTEAPSIPSNLSNMPPCPGIKPELSFTPTLRLTALSAMSPICEAKEAAIDKKISHMPPGSTVRNTAPTAAAATHPATVPDHVFLGLIAGQNFGPPRLRPAK